MRASFRKARDKGKPRLKGRELREALRKKRAAAAPAPKPKPKPKPMAPPPPPRAALPAGFFDEAPAAAAAAAPPPPPLQPPATVSSSTTPAPAPASVVSSSSALPVGFFDDVVDDAEARGIDLKANAAIDLERDWSEFSALTKEMAVEDSTRAALAASESELQDHFAQMEQVAYVARAQRLRAATLSRRRKRAGRRSSAAPAADAAASAAAVAAAASRAAAESRSSLRRRLIAFYRIHDAAKVDKVDALVAKYGAVPEKLLTSLCAKYGVNSIPEDAESIVAAAVLSGALLNSELDGGGVDEDESGNAAGGGGIDVLDLLRARKRRKREAGRAMLRNAAQGCGEENWRSRGGFL